MPHYEQSYQFGKEQEKQVLAVLRDHFNRDIKEYEDRYAHHDFYDDEYDYELKSRTNKKDAFPDTMITMNKLQQLTKPLILVFNYRDQLCFIKYNPDSFAGYRKQMFARSQRDCDKKEHIFIPIDALETICDWC